MGTLLLTKKNTSIRKKIKIIMENNRLKTLSSHRLNHNRMSHCIFDTGAQDLSEALSWINPIPKCADEIIDKIDVASKRLHYAQARQGSSEQDDTTKQRAQLSRLKAEIQSIIGG